VAWAERRPDGTWRAAWRAPNGRTRTKAGFTQRAAAERFAGEQESKARRGEPSYAGRSETWGDWCTRWLELRRVERTTDSSDQTRIERWLRPRWRTAQLVKIGTEDVQVWVNDLADQMAPASVEKVYYLFSASMKSAVKHGRLALSPCRDVELPPLLPPDERFLTREEFDRAAYFLGEPYRTAAIVLVGTGMRFGEMAGLHQHRIHFDARTIDVHETWDGQRVKAYPKGRRKRTVPMPSWAAAALEATMQPRARSCGLPHVRGNACRSGLALLGPQGAPLNAHNMLQRHWARALADAGIDHARQHDLRHSFASWLVQAGRPLHEIAEVLGQTDVSVTRRYAHLANTHLDAVRDVLEATGTFRAIEGGAAADAGDAATFLPPDHQSVFRLRAL
jgi:integrase